jgi:hypothetical protein
MVVRRETGRTQELSDSPRASSEEHCRVAPPAEGRVDTLALDIERALLYYDLWQYPLTAEELFAFLPHNSITLSRFKQRLREEGPGQNVLEHQGFFFMKGRTDEVVSERRARERYARRMWRGARAATHIIKRFPFVRGVFVSGDLSKNVSTRSSDVDFFIITAPDRLWITRVLLTMFKRTFLLNRKRFFCLNTFATTDNLVLEEQNIYLASEIATLKPLYNGRLFREYLQANDWIWSFFPNFDPDLLPRTAPSERQSIVQRLLELAFGVLPCDRLDTFLLTLMERVWARRYPQLDSDARRRQFRSTKCESGVYPIDYQDSVLERYEEKLRAAHFRHG